jgi:hypothetical protein
LLLENDFLWSPGHKPGVFSLFLACLAIYIGDAIGHLEEGLCVGAIMMTSDLLLIGRFFILGKK